MSLFNDSNILCKSQFNNEEEFWIKNYLTDAEYLDAIMPSTPISTKLNYHAILSTSISSIFFGKNPPSPIHKRKKDDIEKKLRNLKLV